jgi:hypothetical protein
MHFDSRQPWSAYAVHLTTLSPPALLGDLLLVWLCHKATGSWGESLHDQCMTLLYMWIFTSKWIKLLGHYLRYPVDVLLLPVSILFGYFHGAIKMYAVMTLNVVCSNLFLFSVFFTCFSVFLLCNLFPYLVHNCRVYPSAAPPFPPPRIPRSYDNPPSQRFVTVSSFLQLCLPTIFPCEPF